MHAVFMLYGKKENVEMLIRDMCATKLTIRYYKEGEKDMNILIECQVRILPFGLYEFIFPKEHMDAVLTALRFHKPSGVYNLDQEISKFGIKISPLKELRKFLRLEEVPEFSKTQTIPWLTQHTACIPIGVRYDGEITEPEGYTHVGWSHEAI